MQPWDKYLAVAFSVIYLIFLIDFIARSEDDFNHIEISCGSLSKVEFSGTSGIRGSRNATMIHLKTESKNKQYRISKNVNKAHQSLSKHTGSSVCVSSLSAPLLVFLNYPIEVSLMSKDIVFNEPLERTYLNNEPYIFWFFLIPISFVLAKLSNSWAAKKRTMYNKPQ